jgi:hypothetical protein
MKPKKIVLSLLIVVCMFSCVFTSRLFAYQRIELMPTTVNAVIRISNGAAFVKALKESPYGKLWNSPEMAPFLNRQSLEKTLIKSLFLGEVPTAAEENAVELYRKMLSLYDGELVVGVGEDSIFVLAEMDDAAFRKNYELSQLENKVRGEKIVYQKHPFQGVELTRQIIDGVEKDSLWTTFYGNTYITGSSREWVEQCVVRIKKELPTVVSGPPSLKVKLPAGFLDRLLGGKQADEKTPAAPNIYRALGIGLGELSLQWVITPSCSELNLRVQNNAGAGGLWTLLSRDPMPRNLYLGYVPDDVLSYQAARLDIHAFWEEIPAILAKLGPQAPAQFQMGLKVAAQMLQVDIERDIIDNLDTLLISYSRLEGLKDHTLYAWRLRDDAAMEMTLGKLFAEGGWLKLNLKDNLETLEQHGHKVYSITIPQYREPEGKTGDQKQPVIERVTNAVAVLDGDLVFGRLEMVRAYINGSRDKKNNRKFYRSPLFTRMIRRVPDHATGYGFSDFSRWIIPAVNFLKTMSSTPESPAEEIAEEDPAQKPENPPEPDPFSEYLENLDYERLPSPEFLRSFFGPWVSYFQFNGKEFIVKWELHNPAGNK